MKITFEMNIDEFNKIGGRLKDIIESMSVEETDGESCKECETDCCSIYAKYFDDTCVGWTKCPEYNLAFLKSKEAYANELLKAKGNLFLNEVYDMLGIDRTKVGTMVGWIYDEKNPIGDNKIDFGIFSLEKNRDFVNGYNNVALLDFNVDGNILQYLEE